MLKVPGENRDTVGGAQRWWSPAGTVDVSYVIAREIRKPGDTWRREKSRAMPDPGLDSLQSGYNVRLCEKLGTC